MIRMVVTAISLILASVWTAGAAQNVVVADSVTHMPLAGASIFDCRGKAIGMSRADGRMPYIARENYPVTVRYLGFRERLIPAAAADTVFLQENVNEMPEVVVESRRRKVLHMLGYVREYSTLTTYSDTVFLFREKMVDYMLPADRKVRFSGWSTPRLLASRSYYRFTDSSGLDSVSDVSSHHFSWSDWVGVAPSIGLPVSMSGSEHATDTLRGKYSPTEIWTKAADRVTVSVNVLADTTSRRWVPDLAVFFNDRLDFNTFRLRLTYSNITGDHVSPMDLTGYSFNIESNGRGHKMFRFNRIDEPFFVSTYAEIYITDREYITRKEARRWEDRRFTADDIIGSPDAPPLQPSIQALVDRVDAIDKDGVKLAQTLPDYGLSGRELTGNKNFGFGRRLLFMLKQGTGISRIKAHRNDKRNWNRFLNDRARENNRDSAGQ